MDVTVCIKEPNADMQDPNPDTDSVRARVTKKKEVVCEK
jgi:hypothetical protein